MNADSILHHDTRTYCGNCGAATCGSYCQYCGQETILHVPSAREFMHEFVAHYVALEGKLWKSLGLLLFKPGRLTRDYIEGRRKRYVEPLRLYLTFSIIFFALFKLSGIEVAQSGAPAQPAGVEASAPAQPARVEASTPALESARPASVVEPAATAQPADGDKALSLGDDADIRQFLASVHPALVGKVERFDKLSGEEQGDALKRAFFSYAPYAIFLLMPLFALLLKLLYLGSGRRYGEHLLFALHSNAFAFLMLSVWMIVPENVPFLRAALVVWLAFYLPTAMRRVYGGSRRVTALRWLVLMSLHMLSIALAIGVAAAMAVIA